MQSDTELPPAEPVAAATPAAPAAPERARIRWGTLALRFGVVAFLVGLDLWSKAGVIGFLTESNELIAGSCGHPQHERFHVFGEGFRWFTFMESYNAGAAFGRFADWPWLLVGGRVLAVGFLIWLVARTPVDRKWFAAALVLVLAGALGNLYDNLAFAHFEEGAEGGRTLVFGRVRDFIDVYFGFADYHFPTFNVADSCITVGAVLLLLTGFAHAREESAAEDAAADAGT